MNIPEKYRERYDRLAESHPWMREMRDGETNGIADDSPLVDELPEGDALDLMKNKGVRQILKVLGIEHDCKKHVTKMLRVLADMVERDYVSREVFEDLRDEFVWETTFLHRMGKKCGTKDVPSLVAYVDKLEAEIIEYDKALDAVKNERDEWKAKALDYEHKLNVELACSDKSIIEALESHNRELKAERDEYRNMAGKMLDAAQEIRRIADASMPEGARAVM